MIEEQVTTEDLRSAVKRELLSRCASGDGRVLEKFRMGRGRSWIDFAIVGEMIHGFEVKSIQRNGLQGLGNQVRVFSRVLDRVTLVVVKYHLDEARRVVPKWWGLQVSERDVEGGVQFSVVRDAKDNPFVDPHALAEFFWRDEAMALLREFGYERGLRGKGCAFVHKRLVEAVDLNVLRARVRGLVTNPDMRGLRYRRSSWQRAINTSVVDRGQGYSRVISV